MAAGTESDPYVDQIKGMSEGSRDFSIAMYALNVDLSKQATAVESMGKNVTMWAAQPGKIQIPQ